MKRHNFEFDDVKMIEDDDRLGLILPNSLNVCPRHIDGDSVYTVFLDNELKDVFLKQWQRRKDQNTLSPYVFPNHRGTGKIKDFRSAWFSGCKTAGIGRRLFHDFRRTAIRNMVRSGTPERLAMMISGHKTRSVFDRYNIVNDADLKAAAKKQADYLDDFTGTISGTIADFPQKKGVNR